jgi:hypothetical protein
VYESLTETFVATAAEDKVSWERSGIGEDELAKECELSKSYQLV